MPDVSWVYFAIGLLLLGISVGYGLSAMRDTQRRMTRVEAQHLADQRAMTRLVADLADQQRRIEQLEARPEPSKHTSVALAQASSADAWLGEAAKVLAQIEVIRAQAENSMLKAEWVKQGGNPDAPWSQIVNWKNGKAKP